MLLHAVSSPAAPRLDILPADPVDPRTAPPTLEDRFDVAGFKYKRHWYGPRYLQTTHPLRHNGGDDETGVLVLDLDDIAPASNSHSAGAAATGHIVAGSFVLGCVGVGLAWGLGAIPAFKQVFESREVLKELKEDDEAVHEHLTAAQAGDPQVQNQVIKNAHAVLALNRANRRLEYVKGTFAGAIAGTGMTLIGAAIILGPEMFGALSAGCAAAAVPLLTVGSALVPVFCAGMVGYEGYRFYRAHQVARHSRHVSNHAVVGTEARAEALLQARLKRIRWHAVANAASFVGLGVGAPLTSFMGPIGLAVLLPGVAGLILAGYYHSKHLHYAEQLAPNQRLRLGNKHEIANRIVLADDEYLTLKALKANKRLLYPFAEESPPPVRQAVKLTAALRRRWGQRHLAYEPPLHTAYTYLQQQAALELQFYRNQSVALSAMEVTAAAAPAAPMLAALRDKRAHLEGLMLHAEREVVDLSNDAAQGLDGAGAIFNVTRFLVRKSLFSEAGKLALRDKSLTPLLYRAGVIEDVPEEQEIHMDANALVLAMLPDSPLSDAERSALREGWARHAERVLLTVEKTRAKYRRHELLDILGKRIENHPGDHTEKLVDANAAP